MYRIWIFFVVAIILGGCDTNDSDETMTTSIEQATDADSCHNIHPVYSTAPMYPRDALMRGISGHVKVSFDIGHGGMPENVAVIESEPAGVFDNEILRALPQWRFPENTGCDIATYTVSLVVED